MPWTRTMEKMRHEVAVDLDDNLHKVFTDLVEALSFIEKVRPVDGRETMHDTQVQTMARQIRDEVQRYTEHIVVGYIDGIHTAESEVLDRIKKELSKENFIDEIVERINKKQLS